MENKLRMLFDYQRFEKNSSLDALIQETESNYARELSDDDLSVVAAAGELTDLMRQPNNDIRIEDN